MTILKLHRLRGEWALFSDFRSMNDAFKFEYKIYMHFKQMCQQQQQ